jgi:hypothetical protein
VQTLADKAEAIADSAIANTHKSNSGKAIAVTSFCSEANCSTRAWSDPEPTDGSVAAAASAPSAHIKSHSKGGSTAHAPKSCRQASGDICESVLVDALFFTAAAILCQFVTSAIG